MMTRFLLLLVVLLCGCVEETLEPMSTEISFLTSPFGERQNRIMLQWDDPNSVELAFTDDTSFEAIRINGGYVILADPNAGFGMIEFSALAKRWKGKSE
jgi:hypothetical protein